MKERRQECSNTINGYSTTICTRYSFLSFFFKRVSSLFCSCSEDQPVYPPARPIPYYERTNTSSLQLVNGMDLKLTAEHLLMGGSCDDSALTLRAAASLHVGDCVRTVSGQEKISSGGAGQGSVHVGTNKKNYAL